jgi:NAD+ synthase (glutamine-hydrolysing)
MDGDTAGSLAPLDGVIKHFIRRWLVWARQNLGYSALDAIIAQAPTAELRPPDRKQTDEKDLMPYDLLEAIENAFIGMGLHPDAIPGYLASFRPESAGELQDHVALFFSLWKRSQWKRERLAPSFHLDRFSIDPRSGGRFPIFSFG